VVSVVGGHTPIGFTSLAAGLPHIRSGKLRAIAVTSKTRSSELPDIPTMAEAGYPDIVGDSWVGLLVPKGTPADITSRLHGQVSQFIMRPETKARLAALGYDPIASTPEQFADRLKTESAVWEKVIAEAKIKVE
jgi:tripartite-type tricarboxylate transporter receptor subunit TctC